MEDIGTFFDAIVVKPMEAGLEYLAALTGSGGIAIILFTLIIRLLLLPLGLKQSQSQKAMASLAPEIAALKQKYPNDRERLAKEQMRLYKEKGVNPAAGCLPLLLQMPVLFGLYYALLNLGQQAEHAERFQERFLWIPNLAQPDLIHLSGLPLPGLAELDISLPGLLPIIMAASQFVTSKMMMLPNADPQQQSMNRMMTIFMPIMLLVFSVGFPAGLVLYWFASNLFSTIQQYFVTGWGGLLPERTEMPVAGAHRSAATDGADAPEPSSRDASGSARGSQRKSKAGKGKRRGKR